MSILSRFLRNIEKNDCVPQKIQMTMRPLKVKEMTVGHKNTNCKGDLSFEVQSKTRETHP